MSDQQRWRYALLALCGLVLTFGAAAARGAAWWGWWTPIRIAGPSMWPALRGPHLVSQCASCGATFASIIDARSSERHAPLSCPHCGRDVPRAAGQMRPGERVLIDTAAYRRAAPRRGDFVAIARAGAAAEVKRVVGLPGERLELREGDLWVDGERFQKSMDELRAVAIRIDRISPPADDGEVSTTRWLADDRSWDRIEGGFRATGCEDHGWLRYRHESHWRGAGSGDPNMPVFDDYPWNADELRALLPADDLMVQFQMDGCGPSDEMQIQLWSHGAARALILQTLQPGAWSVARCDGRWLVEVDGRPFRGQVIARDDDPAAVSATMPVAIGGAISAGAELTRLGVWRDLVLSGPPGTAGPLTVAELAPKHYFVLGDNLPLSADSRQEPSGVSAEQIIGRVWPRDR